MLAKGLLLLPLSVELCVVVGGSSDPDDCCGPRDDTDDVDTDPSFGSFMLTLLLLLPH